VILDENHMDYKVDVVRPGEADQGNLERSYGKDSVVSHG